jgi:hypothetical protein
MIWKVGAKVHGVQQQEAASDGEQKKLHRSGDACRCLDTTRRRISGSRGGCHDKYDLELLQSKLQKRLKE